MEKFASLHRYWICCNFIRDSFIKDLKNNLEHYEDLIKKSKNDFIANHLLFLDSHFILKSYWYSSLYVVYEGCKEIKIEDEEVNKLENEPFLNKLRLFRNGTFHFQKDLYSTKLMDVDDTEDFTQWIYALHEALGKAIIRQMATLLPDKKVEDIFEEIKKTTGGDMKKWIEK